MRWAWHRFEALGVDNLYDLLALRCQAFIVEQVAYLDPDGLDRQAWHLLGRDEAGTLQAGLRLLDPGVKYEEASIGRVAVAAAARGTGLGRVLMQQGLQQAQRVWPGRPLRIGAQAHLAGFYGSLGFVTTGEPYDEDGIPHVEMLRPGSAENPP